MKKRTRQQKYNIKDISYTWGHYRARHYGLIDNIDCEKATKLSLYYNGELIYFVNTKPFNSNILGRLLEENK